jgi:hypothetical protein
MLRLAADENFNADIVRGLRRRLPELDIVRVQDAGLSGVVETDQVICRQCGRSIGESPHAAAEDRKPCPSCGSVARRIEAMISRTLTIRRDIALKHKRPGVKKPLSEQKHRDSLSTKLGRWMRHSRLIDRKNDWYTEAVVDPKTGEMVHHCDEPLSEHRGHGSAKVSNT